MTNKGTPQNRKRKLSESALETPKAKKVAITTPQPTVAKLANTPKKLTQIQKGQINKQQKAVIKTPGPHNSGKVKSQRSHGKVQLKKKNLAEEDDDDDDEDEIDDDSENDEDDEEEDEDEDEEEDEEEDEDEEESEETVQAPNNKSKTLESSNKKSKTAQEKKKKTKSNVQSSGPVSSEDKGRKDDRDARTLFVKNLPNHCTVKHVKALSKDIKQVRLRSAYSLIDNKRVRIGFAYVEFASEAAAETNFKLLSETVMRGRKLEVDYVGSKSSFQQKKQKTEPAQEDPLKLYVSGLPVAAKNTDLQKLFPEAVEISIPRRKKNKQAFGYAFIEFASKEVTDKYHKKGQDLSFEGCKLIVLHARKRKEPSAAEQKKKESRQKQKAGAIQQDKKGSKATAKQSEVDPDDDEDNDEDEDQEDEVDKEYSTKTGVDNEDMESDDDDEDDDDDDEDDDDDDDDKDEDDDDDEEGDSDE